MRVIIAGGRDIHDLDLVFQAVEESGFEVTEVLSGCASGVDYLGEQWAEECGYPVDYFPAQWGKHGKKAGPLRNQAMAESADALIAVWDGQSRGTKDMITRAENMGLMVYVKHVGASG